MKKVLIFVSIVLVAIGLIISYKFFTIMGDHFSYKGSGELKMDATGQVGDFIGGFVGTIFSLSGFFMLLLTFKQQNDLFKEERFESNFFDLIQIHRENVSQLKYSKYYKGKMHSYESRKVIRIIFSEFTECYKEVKKIHKLLNQINDIILPDFRKELENIITINELTCKPEEMALIDISYSVIFFGVSSEGIEALNTRFSKCYDVYFFQKLIAYLRLKPKLDNIARTRKWERLNSFNDDYIISCIEKSHKILFENKLLVNASLFERSLLSSSNYLKYYGGHQYRLGHYFRHLFHSYTFLNQQRHLAFEQKYFYGKTLRVQMSTYEQLMLFVSSISKLGMNWEMSPNIKKKWFKTKKNRRENKLITKYQLIKNLPSSHFENIVYSQFYPDIKYENEQ